MEIFEIPWNAFPSLEKLVISTCSASFQRPNLIHFEFREKYKSQFRSSIREFTNMLNRFQGLTVFIMVSVTQINSSAFEDLSDAVINHKNTLQTAVFNWPIKWPDSTIQSQGDLDIITRERLMGLVDRALYACTRLTFLEIPIPFRSLMIDFRVHLLPLKPIKIKLISM